MTPDRQRIRRAFQRAAGAFDGADFLHREIQARLLERFEFIRLDPKRIIDLGSVPGSAGLGLRQRFPAAEIIAVALVPDMLLARQRQWGPRLWPVCSDADNLPVRDGSMDLVFSNLMLPHCPEQSTVMTEARRTLRYPGLFIFSTLGPQSFSELREAWAEVDDFTHVLPFTDMHDLGDALIHAGFAEPVVDAELITVTYPDLQALHHDLRSVGSINTTESRNPGLTGRRTLQRLRASYTRRCDHKGRLPVTLEIIYGQAWSDRFRTGGRRAGGEYEFPVNELSGAVGARRQD